MVIVWSVWLTENQKNRKLCLKHHFDLVIVRAFAAYVFGLVVSLVISKKPFCTFCSDVKDSRRPLC